MLYLPPGWAHDGVAEGECMTCSIGFRAAGRDELAREVVQRMLDGADPDERGSAVPRSGASGERRTRPHPPALQTFAATAVARCSPTRMRLAVRSAKC
jgi:50S ribosomal protein L16 3-hydroxylase